MVVLVFWIVLYWGVVGGFEVLVFVLVVSFVFIVLLLVGYGVFLKLVDLVVFGFWCLVVLMVLLVIFVFYMFFGLIWVFLELLGGDVGIVVVVIGLMVFVSFVV